MSVAGLYWGQDSNICGTKRDSIILDQYTPPVVNLGQDTILCTSTSILLSDTSTNAAFLWSTGATTSSLNVTSSGTYWLRVTQNTCVGRDTIVIAPIGPPSSFNLGNDTTYCSSFSRTLSIGVAGVNYRWNTGATTSSIPVSVAGLYWGQDSNICGTKRDTIILSQYAPPVVNLGQDTILCTNTSILLSDTSTNAAFLWSTGATTSSLNVVTSGTYWLRVTQNTCVGRDTIVIAPISPPSSFNLGNDTTYCANFSRTLSIGVAGVNYRWNTGAVTPTIPVSVAGLYWGQDSNICGTNRDTIILSQYAPPVVNLGQDTILCTSTSILLNDTSTNAAFLWSTGATTSSLNVITSGTYWLKVTQNTCVGRDTIVIAPISPPSNFNLGNDTTYCASFSRTLFIGVAGVNYRWNTGAVTPSIPVSVAGLYWGQDSNICGTNRDTIVLTQNSPPLVHLGNDTTLCAGSTLVLNDTSTNATFLWSTSAAVSSINVTTSGTYWLQVTQNSCPARDTIVATFQNPSANFSLGNDTMYCANFTRTLSISVPNVSHRWSTGDSTSSISVSTPGLYWGQDSDLCGVKRDTIILTQNTPPVVHLGNDTTLCAGTILVLSDTSSNATFLWSTNATTSSINVTTAGTYWLKVTQSSCPARDTIVATFVSPPTTFSVGHDTTYCNNFIRTLSTGRSTTQWNNGVIGSAITVNAPGVYWAIDSNLCGKFSDTITLNQSTLPALPNIGNDTAYCTSFTRALSIGVANVGYRWSTGATTAGIIVSAPGLYWGQDSNICGVKRDTVILTQNTPPVVNLGNDTTLCVGSTLVLNDTSTNANFLWNTNATTSSINVTTSGTYWLQVTQRNCPAADTILVTFQSPPTAFSLGNDTIYCSNFTHSLSIGVPNVGYRWSTGATTFGIIVSVPGLYWGEDSNQCGTYRDTIRLTQNTPPAVDLGNDTTVCSGITVNLNAGNSGATFRWQDQSSAQNYTVTDSGLYWVNVTAGGCSTTDSILVSYILPPSAFSLGNDKSACEDSGVVLNAFQPNATFYIWNTFDTTPSITVNQAGIYYVTDSNECGSATASVVVALKRCNCILAIPSGFSPNNDGKNDKFGVFNYCAMDFFVMEIYNRWGQNVFTAVDPESKWDGTYMGSPAPMGVYTYKIYYYDLSLQTEKVVLGNVTLLR